MQLTFRDFLEFLTSQRRSGENTYTMSKARKTLAARRRSFFCNKPEVKFTHKLNYTEQYIKKCIISQAPNTTAFQLKIIFNWNTSISGHKRGKVGIPQRKALPRSTANSAVSNNKSFIQVIFILTGLFLVTYSAKFSHYESYYTFQQLSRIPDHACHVVQSQYIPQYWETKILIRVLF